MDSRSLITSDSNPLNNQNLKTLLLYFFTANRNLLIHFLLHMLQALLNLMHEHQCLLPAAMHLGGIWQISAALPLTCDIPGSRVFVVQLFSIRISKRIGTLSTVGYLVHWRQCFFYLNSLLPGPWGCLNEKCCWPVIIPVIMAACGGSVFRNGAFYAKKQVLLNFLIEVAILSVD